MDTRNLAYLGGGVLVVIIGVTIIGIPPGIWIPLGLAAAAIGVGLVIRQAQADGIDVAARIMALSAGEPASEPAPSDSAEPALPATQTGSYELVRPADEAAGVSAVWLHRHGGRRVHRFLTPDGWAVQQVSTKDPDNPKKRVIGETLTFSSQADAITAADDLARGVASSAAAKSRRPGRPVMATFKA
ncbi:MAG: hypothetical protein PVG27_02755 [Chloroflexota bacterium]|jgi:hypothetical protein